MLHAFKLVLRPMRAAEPGSTMDSTAFLPPGGRTASADRSPSPQLEGTTLKPRSAASKSDCGCNEVADLARAVAHAPGGQGLDFGSDDLNDCFLDGLSSL